MKDKKENDYGYFGKGLEGYEQYTTAFNRIHGNDKNNVGFTESLLKKTPRAQEEDEKNRDMFIRERCGFTDAAFTWLCVILIGVAFAIAFSTQTNDDPSDDLLGLILSMAVLAGTILLYIFGSDSLILSHRIDRIRRYVSSEEELAEMIPKLKKMTIKEVEQLEEELSKKAREKEELEKALKQQKSQNIECEESDIEDDVWDEE